MIPIFSKNAAVGVDALTKSIKGLTIEEAIETMTAKNATKAEMEAALLRQGYKDKTIESAMATHANATAKQAETVATRELTAAEAIESLMQKNLLQQEAKELLISSGIVTAKEFEENATIKVTTAKISEAVANGTLSATNAEVIMGAFGITTANTVEAGSFKLLTASIWTNIKAFATWLVTNPIGQAILLTGAIVGLAHAFDLIPKSVEDAESDLSEVQSKLSDVNSEIAERENKIKELEQLETPSLVDKEELKKLKEENEELKIRQGYLEEQEKRANKELTDASKREYSKEFGSSSNKQEAQQYQKTWGSGSKGVKLYTTIENIEKYKDKKSKSTDGEEIEKWDEKIQDAEGDLIDLRTELQEFYDDLSASGASSEELDDVKNKLQQIDDILMSPREQLFKFINSEEVSKNKEELISLAVSGELTSEKLAKNFSGVNTYLKENGFTIEDLVSALKTLQDELDETDKKAKKALTNVDRLSKVESLSNGLDQLANVYKDVKDGKSFDYSSILNNEDFTKTFGGYEEEYNNFIETITKSPKNIKACQEAFDKLATAYINDSDALSNVTEETKTATIAMLKQMGVANATEVVESRLNAKTNAIKALTKSEEANKLVEEGLIETTNDLVSMTDAEIVALINENKASETAREYLENLRLEKLAINNAHIDTSGNIKQIIALAEAAGDCSEYVAVLKELLETMEQAKTDLRATGKAQGGGVRLNLIDEDANEVANNALATIDDVQAKLDLIKDARLSVDDYAVDVEGYDGGDIADANGDSAESFDWIQVKIERLEREISNLDKVVNATYKSWSDRNKALSKEMSKVSSEIDLQKQAYKKYMSLADGVGLSEEYKKLVQSGAIKYEKIANEGLAEKIQKYQEFYELALACEDKLQDLEADLAALAVQSFENVSAEFEDKLSTIEHSIAMIDKKISLTEAKGHIVSTSYYDNLIGIEKNNFATLQQEYTALQKALDDAVASGAIVEGSQDWYQMKTAINDVEQAILDSMITTAEYQKQIRELEWENFDRLRDMIAQVSDETEFLIELMSDEDLFNENGSITEYGQSTFGLHLSNLYTYQNEANAYAKEIEEINKKLANDPYNVDLLERREELINSHQDMILAAQDENQSMIDLAEEGYNKMLDYLGKLIDKRKELLNLEKSSYDYQKTIDEATSEIARLEKIGQALAGDTSEEGQLRKQQNAKELEEARKNLEETQYDKWHEDQQSMLDNLQSSAEEWVDERLKNTDQLLADITSATEKNAQTISDTLISETEKVGYKLSETMTGIWTNGGTENSVVTELQKIENYLAAMIEASDKEVKNITVDSNNSSSSKPSNSSGSTNNSTVSSTTSSTNKQNTSTSNKNTGSKWGSWFISKKDNTSHSKLDIENSIVDFNESTLNALNCGKTLRA